MGLVRAAQYIRMSTEHQRYSPERQAWAIAEFARARGYEIVATYRDDGISGLSMRRREGLKALIADVLGGEVGFELILVYDISRWGRFQDPDESAHYEFLCRAAGVRVEYCSELFENDGSVPATILKHLKRIMAGEYSRELSAKVALAQRRLAERGYWQGGVPGYGLRRQLIDHNGRPGAILEYGEQKALSGHRVRLVHGPADEVATVRRIFRLYVANGLGRAAIARLLNGEGVLAGGGAKWTAHRVEHVLSSEKYVGVMTFGETYCDLASGQVRRHPRSAVLRIEGALPPMVPRKWFEAARRNLGRRPILLSREAMLDGLRELFHARGTLTADLINEAEHLPCAQTYRNRFGRLLSAYAAVGFQPDGRQIASANMVRKGMTYRHRDHARTYTDQELIDGLRQVCRENGRLSVSIINEAASIPGAEFYRKRFGAMDRVYALAGYQPSPRQEAAIANMKAQYATGARMTAERRQPRP